MPATPDLAVNFATSTVLGGTGGVGTALGPSDSTLILNTGDGAKFPTPTATRTFPVFLGTVGGTREIARCTARVGDSLTITRGGSGAEGTSQLTWAVGSPVEGVWSAASLNGVSNMLIRHLVGLYNVRDYGALGDGSTDDSTAITNANTAAAAAAPAIVYFPAGTYLSGNQTIQPNVQYVGDGPDISIVKLKNNANVDLFSGQTGNINLGAANKTGPDGTLYGFQFRDLTLDGNNTNQSSGPSWVLRFYAYHYKIHNCHIRNGYTGVVQADWNGPDNQINNASIESQWTDVKIYTTLNGPLFQFGGPHDSQFENVLVFDGKDTSLDGTGKLTPGIHIGPNAAGALFTNTHSWNNNLPFLVEAESYFSNCVADISNRGTNQGIGLLLLAGLTNWTGGTLFGSTGSAASTGIQIGQTGGGTPKTPYMTAQSAGLTTAVAPTKCYFDTVVLNTDNGGINFVNSGGSNIFGGLIHCGSGSATGGIQGTQNTGDTLRWRVANITPDGNNTTGGTWILSLKSKQALSVQDPANAHETLRVDTFNQRMQMPWATSLIGYSDGFTTKKWSVNEDGNGSIIIAGTGNMSLGQSATAPAVASSGTITTAATGVSRVAPAAAVTGVILQAGTIAGQVCMVVNESAAASSVTFAAAGTSNVADGVSAVIPGLTQKTFVWDSSTSRWYHD